jgi:hypothetical protein
MDYLMVLKPITSLAIFIRTKELHHCTLFLDTAASQKGAVQVGCSAYTSHRDVGVMAPLMEGEIQRAPYNRQVAHVGANVVMKLRGQLGTSKAWANNLATDRLLHAHVTVPGRLWGRQGQVAGTVASIIPLDKAVVPAAVLEGSSSFATVREYTDAVAQLERAMGSAVPRVTAATPPLQLGDLLLEVQMAAGQGCLALPLSMLARELAAGHASVEAQTVAQQLEAHVYALASRPSELLRAMS